MNIEVKKIDKSMESLLLLLEQFGSTYNIARAFGIAQSSVFLWFQRRKIPIGRVSKACELSYHKLTPQDFRPDIFK